MLAVEPSATMRAQRPPGSAPAIDARAESLPLDDDAVDAAMACITIHHWEPADCTDGFVEAFFNRPEALLDPEVRGAQSMWALLGPGAEERIVERLRGDLESGAWDAARGHLRELGELEGSLRLVMSENDQDAPAARPVPPGGRA